MAWLDALADIEDLEDAPFDAGLVAEFERKAADVGSRPIRFSTPTFREYESSELEGCGKNSFPAFSITAGACGLNCDHCQKKILEPMIPATNPEMLDSRVRHLIATQGLNGFLLSGGSNRKNEINYSRYLPVVEQLKTDYPDLKVAIHSALLDEARARDMESAGVDTVMMDVIGANDTIRDVFKLDRPGEDGEATLAALDAYPESDLDKEAPEEMRSFCPTMGDVFTLIATHPLMHAGQFVIVRRQLGKPILM